MGGIIMKQFNLEEYLKNPSRKVVTRNGKSVRIVCTDFNNESYPIIGEVQGVTEPQTFTKEGLFCCCNCDSSNRDLFFAPEKHEGWVNVCKSQMYNRCGLIHNSEEEARRSRGLDAIATVKIEWEE